MSTAGGLRERKKAETRTAIAASARELASERGVDGFTVEDVAARADVSPRTFFNYFATKEDAIIGLEPSRIDEMTARLAARPRNESPLNALRAAFTDGDEQIEAKATGFAARIELVHRYPELMARHLAATHEVEQRLAEAMADRLDLDITTDPYPTIVVSVGVSALRSTMLWWHQNGQPGDLAEHIDDAFASLARGLPRSSRHGAPVRRRSTHLSRRSG